MSTPNIPLVGTQTVPKLVSTATDPANDNFKIDRAGRAAAENGQPGDSVDIQTGANGQVADGAEPGSPNSETNESIAKSRGELEGAIAEVEEYLGQHFESTDALNERGEALRRRIESLEAHREELSQRLEEGETGLDQAFAQVEGELEQAYNVSDLYEEMIQNYGDIYQQETGESPWASRTTQTQSVETGTQDGQADGTTVTTTSEGETPPVTTASDRPVTGTKGLLDSLKGLLDDLKSSGSKFAASKQFHVVRENETRGLRDTWGRSIKKSEETSKGSGDTAQADLVKTREAKKEDKKDKTSSSGPTTVFNRSLKIATVGMASVVTGNFVRSMESFANELSEIAEGVSTGRLEIESYEDRVAETSYKIVEALENRDAELTAALAEVKDNIDSAKTPQEKAKLQEQQKALEQEQKILRERLDGIKQEATHSRQATTVAAMLSVATKARKELGYDDDSATHTSSSKVEVEAAGERRSGSSKPSLIGSQSVGGRAGTSPGVRTGTLHTDGFDGSNVHADAGQADGTSSFLQAASVGGGSPLLGINTFSWGSSIDFSKGFKSELARTNKKLKELIGSLAQGNMGAILTAYAFVTKKGSMSLMKVAHMTLKVKEFQDRNLNGLVKEATEGLDLKDPESANRFAQLSQKINLLVLNSKPIDSLMGNVANTLQEMYTSYSDFNRKMDQITQAANR